MTTADVTTIVSTVTIDGVARDVGQVSIDREIATDLPKQVTGGGGLDKATGTVVLDEDGPVVTERQSPWAPQDGWPPQRSVPVTIDTTVGDGEVSRRFTGRTESVSGTAADPVTVDVEDAVDDLAVPFSHEPMHETMPPRTDTGDMRRVGLRADYYADLALRRGGFRTTPDPAGLVLLHAPMQGSMWPATGDVQSSGEITSTTGQPDFVPSPWGWAATNTETTYRRDNVTWTMRGRVLAVGLMVAPDHTDTARVDVTLGSDTLNVRVHADRRVDLRVNGANITNVTPDAGWTRVEVLFGQTYGGARVKTDTGWQTDVFLPLPGSMLDSRYTSTMVRANQGAKVGGVIVQIAPSSYSGSYATQTLNATMRVGSLLAPVACMPALTPSSGLDLLREISEALVVSMWIDRVGHLWWVHPDRLRDQAPAATVTADADLLDLAWQDTADSARRSVEVEHRQPVARRRKQARITVWEGNGDNLHQGETTEEIITPPADIDWVMLETDLTKGIYCTPRPGNPDALPDFNRGIGSWVGGTHLDAGGDSPATRIEDGGSLDWTGADNYPRMTQTLERIGPQAWKLTVGLMSQPDKQWREIQQALDPVPRVEGVPAVRSGINGSWAGQKMPLLRTKGTTTWDDATVASTIAGPDGYEALTHDAGPWAGTGATALADWIAAQVTVPSPILRDLPIVYRTDIDLGDVIDVIEDAVYHVRLRVLIVGLSEKHQNGDSSLTLTCRVLTAEPTRLTYHDQAATWVGRTYAALAAEGGTYSSRKDA